MQIGITGLSVLVGFGLQHINPFLAAFLLMVLVPLLAIFITAGALGEFFRATRASSFLAYRKGLSIVSFRGPGLGSRLRLPKNGNNGFDVIESTRYGTGLSFFCDILY
jgi:hypothetical protein